MVALELVLEDVLFSVFGIPFQRLEDQDKNIHRINALLGIVITGTEKRCMVELHFCGLCGVIPLNDVNGRIIPVVVCYDPSLCKGRC